MAEEAKRPGLLPARRRKDIGQSGRQGCAQVRHREARRREEAVKADTPEKAAKAEKAEDKLAELVGRPASVAQRPLPPPWPARQELNEYNADFDDAGDGEGEVLPELKPVKRGRQARQGRSRAI